MTVSDTGTLAMLTTAALAMKLLVGPTMTRGGKLLSVRGGITAHTLTAGNGPLLVGLARNGLSDAAIEEFLEIEGPVSPSDSDAMEKSSRGSGMRTLGLLTPSGNGTTAGLFLDNKSLSGLKFSEESAGWKVWAYNLGTTMTTGSFVVWQLQFFVEFNPSG